MQQDAGNGGGHTTGAAEEQEPYDDELYEDGADQSGNDSAYEGAVVQEDDSAAGLSQGRDPDVFLDVPQLKVDELNLDVENLRARVSLQAEVLDLLKLNVGADVALGEVHLGISGVEAQAQLKVRLDNVALIINRVLTTLDRNPQILEDLARGVGSAVHDVGRGAGTAVQEVGEGAGSAVEDVGSSAGEAVGEVAQGVGEAVEGVGGSAAEAADEVGRAGVDAGDEVRETGPAAGRSVRHTSKEAGAGRAAGKTTPRAGGTAGSGTRSGHGTSRTASQGGAGPRRTPGRTGYDAEDKRSVGRRRTRDDEAGATRPTGGRRGVSKREEPP
ncbi:hypothetical protein ACGH7X_38760 [Streptomyces sp. BBFR51]|uniref:hypothetical protein n=1 Tax=Streptomyces sp. BBFR51 TaxID=3372856 RepID=UPI0037DD22B8